MAQMMAAPRNRAPIGVDDPWDDDGFWRRRKFKANRRTGQPTGGRMWRRAVRHIEAQQVRAEIAQALRDQEDDWQELLDQDEAWGATAPEHADRAPRRHPRPAPRRTRTRGVILAALKETR